jgi:hypothetical protein
LTYYTISLYLLAVAAVAAVAAVSVTAGPIALVVIALE